MKKISFFLILFFSLILSGCTLINNGNKEANKTINQNITSSNNKDSNVPLPSGEDIVRTYINLISEKRIPEAVSMMDIPDETQKQGWGVELNSFDKISLKNIEKNGTDAFKVTLSVKMKPESANAPIPYYGFDNGDNIRWIGLRKGSNNLWKITGFATSPINLEENNANINAGDENEICKKFTKEFVSSKTGKEIVRIKPFSMSGTVSCSYFLDDNSFIIIVQDELSVEKQKQGLEYLGRTLKTSPKIKREHVVVYQEDNNINSILLILNPNKFVRVDRSSLKALNNEEIIDFANKVSEKL